jgi:ACS family hexuronate transporter-like MFS transporter
MSVAVPDLRLPGRSRSWRWWVCGLLLLATMVNYMDRLTLGLLAPRIQADLHLSDLDYARVESSFAVAFALGAIVMGWLADRASVYWMYPITLIAWSAAGVAAGFVEGFVALLVCRFLLGFAESGHWPCAIRTTQHILPPAERTLGNSILQSGAAFGSILIPLIALVAVDPAVPGSWRRLFLLVGVCGTVWAAAWLFSIRRADLAGPGVNGRPLAERTATVQCGWLVARRIAALMVMVVLINATWHYFRVWLTRLLETLHYNEQQRSLITAIYYLAAALGSLSAGWLTLLLSRRGLSIHASRMTVFLGYGLLAGLAVCVPFLAPGPLVLGVLLTVGFGSLGVFPAYYSFTQELTVKHQGKLTGVMGCTCWLGMAVWQEMIGEIKTYFNSFAVPTILAGCLPLAGFAALLLLWGRDEKPAPLPVSEEAPVPISPSIQTAAEGVTADAVHGVTR